MIKMWEARHYKARLEEAMVTLKMSGCVPPLQSRFKIRLKSIHFLGRKTLTVVDTQRCLISPKCSTFVQVLEIPREVIVPLFEPSPRRRGLAWARPFSLSEELGEIVWCLVVYCSWMIGTCLGMIVMMKNMKWTTMYEWMVHGWWMMGMVWTWHVN